MKDKRKTEAKRIKTNLKGKLVLNISKQFSGGKKIYHFRLGTIHGGKTAGTLDRVQRKRIELKLNFGGALGSGVGEGGGGVWEGAVWECVWPWKSNTRRSLIAPSRWYGGGARWRVLGVTGSDTSRRMHPPDVGAAGGGRGTSSLDFLVENAGSGAISLTQKYIYCMRTR
jgi:hypothetical protein